MEQDTKKHTAAEIVADEIMHLVFKHTDVFKLRVAIEEYIATKATTLLVEENRLFNIKEDVISWICSHSDYREDEGFEDKVHRHAKSFFETSAGRLILRTIEEDSDSDYGTWTNIESALEKLTKIRPCEYSDAIKQWFNYLGVDCYPFR